MRVFYLACLLLLVCSSSLSANPQVTQWMRRGRSQWLQGNVEAAIESYQQAARLDPRNPQILNSIGFLLSQRQRYGEAIAVLQQSARLDPNNIATFLALGFALGQNRQLDEAGDAYRHVLSLDNKNIDAFKGLGFVLSQQGDWVGAEQMYRQVIRLSPRDVKAYLSLGYALQQQGNFQEAIKVYQTADRVSPLNPDLWVALGDVALRQNQIRQAQEKYQRALELNPRHGGANLAMAKLWEVQGDLERAISAYTIASRYSNNREIYRKIANLQLQRNFTAAAIVAYRQLLERFPDDAPTYLELGRIFVQQKRRSEARQMLERAAAFYSNDPSTMATVRSLLEQIQE
ncbi:MAG: tetratricopeptide repeat protein [Pseudanabaenaceae cyanobacterium SKYGB_i_bin29]|nr:tetratricopeptide repeat protein [Pseudanabaenaceae cyanobacterium SKYG29]MDW8421164.1 tetratricopeptide repeat protein [Pseudanabaenaceae cyanobacterium SKYGB_i_bin29]